MATHSRELSLFLVLVGVGHVLCETPKYVQTGTNYTFNPNLNPPLESILWKYKNDKVVEFEDNFLKWFQFKDQGSLNNQNGVFTLNGLKKSQSGLYESEIQVKGKLQYSKHDIRVIDAVVKPEVKCIKNSDGAVTSLECFLQTAIEEVTFSWTGPGDKKATGNTLPIVNITDGNTPFYCTATNPLNKMSTEFYLRECYPEAGSNTGAIVGGVVGLVVLLAVAVAVAFIIIKRSGVGYTPASKGDTETGNVPPDVPLKENTSNSNNCPKDDGKLLESSNNIGHDNNGKNPSTEKVQGSTEKLSEIPVKKDTNQVDLDDDSKTDPVRVEGPTAVNSCNDGSSEEKAEEAQEVPASAEKGQGATPTAQEPLIEPKSNMAESNGDPQRVGTVIDFIEESIEESAEGQDQIQDTFPLDNDPGNDENGS